MKPCKISTQSDNRKKRYENKNSLNKLNELKFCEVSAFYLEKQKNLFLKKKIFVRSANIHPKDSVSRLNFPEGFAVKYKD